MLITNTTLPASIPVKPKRQFIGREPGMVHLKALDIEDALIKLGLDLVLKENPFIAKIGLYENPYLMQTLARTDIKENRIEISTRLINSNERDIAAVILKALANFLAIKHNNYHGGGRPYQRFIQRYSGVLLPKPDSVQHPLSSVNR